MTEEKAFLKSGEILAVLILLVLGFALGGVLGVSVVIAGVIVFHALFP